MIAARGSTRLLDCGGSGRPVVLVPSIINGPEVLDLAPGASLVEALIGSGMNPLMVDWGVPTAAECADDLGALVTRRLLPLLGEVGEGFDLVGYCLGGTIAVAAAVLARPRRVALIATPWRFAGYPDTQRASIARLWDQVRPAAQQTGIVPLELIQPAFWELDPLRTVEKFERFGAMLPETREARHYVLVEDWVNGGPPITAACARQLFEDFYAADHPGQSRWVVGGTIIQPQRIGCPMLNLPALKDRIAPAASAPAVGLRVDLPAGHVGLMVGGSAARLLYRPMAEWLNAR